MGDLQSLVNCEGNGRFVPHRQHIGYGQTLTTKGLGFTLLRNPVRIAAMILILLLATCSEPTTTQPIIITRDDSALPQGCNPDEVAQLIMRFLDAFNKGDQEILEGFFALAGERWFSDTISEEEHFTTYTQAELLDYFTLRHQNNDRLQLIKVNVSPRGLREADITFQMTREADDIEPGKNGRNRYVQGKGAIFCRTQKFMVWSMGTAPPNISPADYLSQVCPDPPSNIPENAVIACARG